MERPHCAPQRSSRKHVSDVSSSTSLISSCTMPSACGGAGFSHLGFCTHIQETCHSLGHPIEAQSPDKQLDHL